MNFYQRYIQESMDTLHRMTIRDIMIFKLMIVFSTLWIAKAFPVLLSLDVWVYMFFWGLAAGYVLSIMNWKNIIK